MAIYAKGGRSLCFFSLFPFGFGLGRQPVSRLVVKSVRVLVEAHLREQEVLHFLEFGSVRRIGGEIRLVGFGLDAGEGGDLRVVVGGEEFVGVLPEVEELGFADAGAVGFLADEFPVALADRAHAGFFTGGIDAVECVTNRGFFTE